MAPEFASLAATGGTTRHLGGDGSKTSSRWSLHLWCGKFVGEIKLFVVNVSNLCVF